MADEDARIPTGKTRRAAKTATALAPGSVRLLGSVAANVARDPERGQEILARRAGDLADAAVDILGSMKGGAMKVGQLLSFVDAGMVPEAYRSVYQEKLASLRDSAPTMSWRQVEKVLADELDEPLRTLFRDIDHQPAAAASIGQVHRAVTADGRDVAVKVQYPEIADALHADVGTAGLLIRLARILAPGLDPGTVAGELKERILEELDYELEAQHQRRFARYYRDHPFIHVPGVMTELSRRRVLVTDWVDGDGFDAMKARSQDERNAIGETIYRFVFGTFNRLGFVNTDVHPGNYRLRADGGVVFMDFGNCKQFDMELKAFGIAVIKAIGDGDEDALRHAMINLGYLRPGERGSLEPLIRQAKMLSGWYLSDRVVQATPELVGEGVAAASDPRTGVFELRKLMLIPPEEIWVRRIETGTFAVLGHLRASANWHRIGREWWFDEAPATELGRTEHEWLTRRAA